MSQRSEPTAALPDQGWLEKEYDLPVWTDWTSASTAS
jgi:hypothetical protein